MEQLRNQVSIIEAKIESHSARLATVIDGLSKEIHQLALSNNTQTIALESFIKLNELQIKILTSAVDEAKKKSENNEIRLNAYDVKISKVLGIWAAIMTSITLFGRDVWNFIRGH